MKIKIYIIPLLFFYSCGNQPAEKIKITKELLQGTWQFVDKDKVYTEMEISDSVYYYVHTPMNIMRAEPVLYNFDADSFRLVYEDGEIWKSYGISMPDSFTLVTESADEGKNTCKKIYPKMKISSWKQEDKFTYDTVFLSREKKFNK